MKFDKLYESALGQLSKANLIKECFHLSQFKEFLKNNPEIKKILLNDTILKRNKGDVVFDICTYAGAWFGYGPFEFSVKNFNDVLLKYVQNNNITQETYQRILSLLKSPNIWTPPNLTNLDNPSTEQINYIKNHVRQNLDFWLEIEDEINEGDIDGETERKWLEVYHLK